MKSFKTLRIVITIVDVVCLLAVLFVPALETAKHNFFVWLILGLLTLYVLFMWLVLGRRNTNGYDAESDREADISKELLSQRNTRLLHTPGSSSRSGSDRQKPIWN